MCDILYSTDDAKFGLPELTVGTIPGAGGTQRLTRAVGKQKAMDMILTSCTVSGKELRRLGLVAQTWPAEELLPQVSDIAPPSLMLSKQVILIFTRRPWRQHIRLPLYPRPWCSLLRLQY
jgi:enoyl-CoA hydratase/carnithine racemase